METTGGGASGRKEERGAERDVGGWGGGAEEVRRPRRFPLQSETLDDPPNAGGGGGEREDDQERRRGCFSGCFSFARRRKDLSEHGGKGPLSGTGTGIPQTPVGKLSPHKYTYTQPLEEQVYMLTCMQTCTACRLCQLLDGRAQHVAVLTARHVFPDPLLCTSSTDKMVCSPSVRTLECHRKMATTRRAQRHLTPRIHCLVCNPLRPSVCTGSLGERRLPAVAVNVV